MINGPNDNDFSISSRPSCRGRKLRLGAQKLVIEPVKFGEYVTICYDVLQTSSDFKHLQTSSNIFKHLQTSSNGFGMFLRLQIPIYKVLEWASGWKSKDCDAQSGRKGPGTLEGGKARCCWVLSVELRSALIYIVVVGWAHVEGRVTKHYFCFITCLPSQRERFFL